jgi:hypothetical protein
VSCWATYETEKNHVAHTRSSKEAFQGLFSLGPELGTSQENDAEQGSPGWTIAPRVHKKKWMRISADPIPGGTRRGNGHNCHSQEAHYTGQGGVESVRVVTRHSRALKHECPTSNHCYQAGGLTEACKNLVGRRRSAQEIKKGHGSVSHDHSVVLPTRVFAQPVSRTNAIDACNSHSNPALVCLRIRQLSRYCLAKTR